MATCANNCSNRGTCVNGTCVCYPGYLGDDCSRLACPSHCSHHGICNYGQCVCYHGYMGESCDQRACPADCNERGYCVNGALRYANMLHAHLPEQRHVIPTHLQSPVMPSLFFSSPRLSCLVAWQAIVSARLLGAVSIAQCCPVRRIARTWASVKAMCAIVRRDIPEMHARRVSFLLAGSGRPALAGRRCYLN